MNEIEIIGGGLAGLSLGIALKRAGVAVTVFEAGEYPRHRVCGEFITGLDGTTIARLDLAPVLADALMHEDVGWFARDSLTRTYRLPQPAYGLSRHVLDGRLAEKFVKCGGSLQTHTRITDLAPRAGRVFATGRKRTPSPWIGLKIHAHGLRLRKHLELHLGNSAYVGLSKVEGDAVNVCGLFRRRSLPSHETAGNLVGESFGPTSAAQFFTLFDYLEHSGFSVLAARLRESDLDRNSFCSVAALPLGGMRQRSDRIEIGDAWKMTPPYTGNGMAIAFQSAAAVLGPVLEYARGEQCWRNVVAKAQTALGSRFRLRLATADSLHPFLLQRSRQKALAALSRMGLLPFRLLYSFVH